MNDLRRHMRPVTLAFWLCASTLTGMWGGLAQTPVGTTIRNEAVGRFLYKSGDPDSIQSNAAEVVVTQSVPALELNLQPSRMIVRRDEILQFTLRYRNPGNGPAVAISAVDSLPPQVTFVYATRGGQIDGNRVVWNSLGSLMSGEEDSVVVSVRVRGDLMPPDSIIINRARIRAANVSTVSDSAFVYVRFDTSNGTPNIVASKSVDLTTARPGMTLQYALQVTNTGNGAASGVTIVDSLPSHTTFVAATNGGIVEGGAIVWRPDTLWANSGFGAGIVLRINAECPNGYLDNTARVFADGTRTQAAGPARTLVSSALAVSMSLALSSSAIPGNGVDSVQACVTVRDGSGNPVGDGIPVVFTTSAGLFPNQRDSIVVFTNGGVACVFLRSSILAGTTVHVVVGASTVGANGSQIFATAVVSFYPSAIAGTVLSALGNIRIAGGIADVFDVAGQPVASDTTGIDGLYLIPIDVSGAYTCIVTAINSYGERITTTFRTSIQVPSAGANPPHQMLSTISGSLVDRVTGQRIQEQGVPLNIEQLDQQKTSGGRSVPAQMQTDSKGAYLIDSLGMGIYVLNVRTSTHSGSIVVSDTLLNAFIIDANIGLDAIPGFEITKTVNKRIAEIGDAVTYALEIRNVGGAAPINHIRVVDQLPTAFVYASGTTRIDGLPAGDPSGSRRLEWQLPDTLTPGQTLRLAYMVTIGAAALESDCINRAYAVARVGISDSIQTPEASVQITVRPGVFTDRGIVIGKVFYDLNENGHQDEGEKGIYGVELWMEDGTRIVTGDDGKYSLPEVLPGQHVIRVNTRTLPAGSVLLAQGSEFAGDGLTRFIRLTESGIARADFFVRAPNQASVEMCLVPDPSDSLGIRKQAIYVVRWNTMKKPENIVLQDSLPQGWHYVLDSSSVWPSTAVVNSSSEQARVLKINLLSRTPGTSDVVRVGVAPDSIPVNAVSPVSGSLVFTYPMRREAVINGTPLSVPMEYVDMLIARTEAGRKQMEKAQPASVPDSKKPLAVVIPPAIAPQPVVTAKPGAAPDKSDSVVAPQKQEGTGKVDPAHPVVIPSGVGQPAMAEQSTAQSKAAVPLMSEDPESGEQSKKTETGNDTLKASGIEGTTQDSFRVQSVDSIETGYPTGGGNLLWTMSELLKSQDRARDSQSNKTGTGQDTLAGRGIEGVAQDSIGAQVIDSSETGYSNGGGILLWSISGLMLILVLAYFIRRYLKNRML